MFNAGVIAASLPTGPVIQLTGSSRVSRVTGDWGYVYLNRNGTLYMSLGDTAESGVAQFIPNEWVRSGGSTIIGDSYEAMLSPSNSSGWAASGGGTVLNEWRTIGSMTDFRKFQAFVAGESFTLRIREKSTGTVVATATYYAAP